MAQPYQRIQNSVTHGGVVDQPSKSAIYNVLLDIAIGTALSAERHASAARAATPHLSTTLPAQRLNALVRRFLITCSSSRSCR